MRRLLPALPLLLAALLTSCSRPPPPVVPPAPPVVRVTTPRVQMVTDYQDFTGRVRASDTVELKARVTGYLSKFTFTEGGAVSAGQPLFELEPGTLETDLTRANAVVEQARVTRTNRQRDYDRVYGLATAPALEKDKARAELDDAKQSVIVAEKQAAAAQRLFDYTRIAAPKAGRIGRKMADVGTLVQADITPLATVVVEDPMHLYFDVDDRTNLRLNRLREEGKLNLEAGTTQVKIGLPDQDGFPPAGRTTNLGLLGGLAAAGWEREKEGFTGVVTFIDTSLTSTTGTRTLRAEVPNPESILTANQFVRVRLPVGEPKRSLLVPEEAIGTDQGLKFVYVLTAADEVEYRQVQPGLQVGTDRVIDGVPGRPGSGVREGERVVTEGLQRLRKGMKVQVKGPGAGG